MHSCRMHTTRSLLYGGISVQGRVTGRFVSRGFCVQGGLCLGSLSGGVSVPGGVSHRHPPGQNLPPVDRMTDARKNITLPQTLFAGGNYLIFVPKTCL